MKSPAETAEAHSESDDDGTAGAASDVEAGDANGDDGDDGDAESATQDAGADSADGSTDEDRAESGTDDEPAAPKGRSRSKIRWIAAVVLVAVLAVAGYEGWVLFQHHQKDVAAAQALEAAEKFAVTLTTIDPNAIDTNIAGVLDGSTGQFKDLYQQSSAQLRQVLIDNKAAANGMVIDAGVKSATKDRVEVVLFIDQAVSNATAPAPQLDRSRVVMTMEKVDGRWLASKVDLP
ncbi:MAG: Mce protein [Mycobacterium sp.]|nr:Mce protein [Mycobacterium sp.]